MMANLDVADDASPQDQEAALKELVASTSDMTSVADFVRPFLSCPFSRAVLHPRVRP